MRGPLTATKYGPQLGHWGAEAGLSARHVVTHRTPAVRHLLGAEKRHQSPAGRRRPCRRGGAERAIDIHTELSEANPTRERGGGPRLLGGHRRGGRVYVKRHGSSSSQRTVTYTRRAPGRGRDGRRWRRYARRDGWCGRSRGSRSRRGRAGGGRGITANRDGVPVGALAQRGARRIEGSAGVAGEYSEERGRGSRSRCEQSVLERARRHVERICTSKVLWGGGTLALQEGRGQ